LRPLRGDFKVGRKKMENLPEIKWHVQKLVKFLEQDPNDPAFTKLCVNLDTTLNSSPLKLVDAVADIHGEDGTKKRKVNHKDVKKKILVFFRRIIKL
jgi:hypothetical protein